jgi:hypothetical protein
MRQIKHSSQCSLTRPTLHAGNLRVRFAALLQEQHGSDRGLRDVAHRETF